jgi:pimeloyl-ACP methyl ester carboxylesterase
MSKRRNLGIVALATGAVGAAAGGAIALEHRAVGRERSKPDPYADEPLGKLHTEGIEVRATDGLALHVEVDGNQTAPVTIVFAHGFTLSMDSFHFQRRDLGDDARLVFYDQRSHGRSERSDPKRATIDQLGKDLFSVLQAVAPTGPVILAGHSMGGMTILALADQHPELFGDRIVGVALLSTSTGQLAKEIVGLPGWLSRAINPAVPQVAKLVRRRATFLERNRKIGTDFAYLATRRLSYGPDVPPALVDFMEQMLTATPIDVMSEFFDTFLSHDKLKALDVLLNVPTLISVGDLDVLTPLSHSQLMAAALPDAELQVIYGAGHMAMIDRHVVVNGALRRLRKKALNQVHAAAG